MDEMHRGRRHILETLLVLGIILLCVFIFLKRDSLTNLGNVSYLGVFLICFLANATVFLPSPSLIFAASCALVLNPWAVGVTAALGSSAGELVGYLFGCAGKELSPRFQKLLLWADERISSEWLWVFLLALLPLPLFDFAGVFSGGIRMNLWKFFLACFLGKLIKLLVYIRLYGLIGSGSGLI